MYCLGAMPSKTPKKKQPTKKPLVKTGDQVTIAPDYSRAFPTFYANFAMVNHSQTDITVDLCLLAPPYQIRTGDKTVALVPPVARIVLPGKMIEGLIPGVTRTGS